MKTYLSKCILSLKIASIALVKFAAIGLAVATVFSIVKIALG